MTMRIKVCVSLLLMVFLGTFVLPAEYASAQVITPVWITAPSAVLIDHNTERIIYSKTPYLRRAPASTVKVLTAMVVMDQLPLHRVISVPAFAQKIPPSKINLRAGDKYRVRDLLRAMLISSANDAAEVLGWAVAGSNGQFGDFMNRKAQAIGCQRSHFVRPSGLPAENQYSTAYDLAMIMHAAQRYPFIVETLKQRYSMISSFRGRKSYLKNHNKMLWRDRREIVGKTGWTRAAKHCFVGHISVNQRKVLVALMGSNKLWKDLKRLVDYQFGMSYNRVSQKNKLYVSDKRKRIQVALKKAGFNPGRIDGYFGRTTIRAIKKFQKSNGLRADGVVGSLTWNKLKSYL